MQRLSQTETLRFAVIRQLIIVLLSDFIVGILFAVFAERVLYADLRPVPICGTKVSGLQEGASYRSATA